MMNAETEIRKLRPAELFVLASTLTPDSWKLLMGIIPKDGSQNIPMFTKEHLKIIESTALKQHRLPAEIFLEEWSTMGRNRPTIRSLIHLLVQVELFRAADYLAVDVLKEEPPKRPPNGPAAPVDICINLEEISNDQNVVQVKDDNLQHVYEDEKYVEDVAKFPFNSKSDLMKFSTDSLSEEKNYNNDIKYGEEQEEFVLPNFEKLNINSDQDRVNNQGKMTSEQSSDLLYPENSENLSTCETSCSANSRQSSDDSYDLNFNSDELPTILKEINRREAADNSEQTNEKSIHGFASEEAYRNLPLPIVELCKR